MDEEYPLPRVETEQIEDFPPGEEPSTQTSQRTQNNTSSSRHVTTGTKGTLDFGASTRSLRSGFPQASESALSLPPTSPKPSTGSGHRRGRRVSVASSEGGGAFHRIKSFLSYKEETQSNSLAASSLSSIPSEIATELQKTFEQMDTDNTGTLDKKEILDMLIRLGEDPTPEDVNELVDLVDNNGDGELTFDEFKAIYRELDSGNTLFKRLNFDKLLGAPSILEDAEVTPDEHDKNYYSIPLLERLGAAYLKYVLKWRARTIAKKAAKRDCSQEINSNDNIPQSNSGQLTKSSTPRSSQTPTSHKRKRGFSIVDVLTGNKQQETEKEVTTNPLSQWPPVAPIVMGILYDEGDYPPPAQDVDLGHATINQNSSDNMASPATATPKDDKFVTSVHLFTDMQTECRADDFSQHKVGEATYHTVNENTLRKIRWIAYWTIIRAIIYGGISATASGLFELQANIWWPNVGGLPWTGTASTKADVLYWGLVLGTMCIFTLIEILAIYVDSLTSSIKQADLAGLKLYPLDTGRAFMTRALSRAALEINHPCYQLYGIDPLRHHSTLKRFTLMLAYKAKSGVTVFLFRLLVRRIFGRALAKTALPFLAAPLIMLWNGLVCWKVMSQARLLILGPPTLLWLSDALLAGTSLSYFMRRQLFRTVGVALVKNAEVHPNLEVLLRHLHTRMGLMRPREDLDDFMLFIHDLSMCSREEQLLVMKFLVIAFMADGILTPRDRRYLRKTMSSCGLKTGLSRLKAFGDDFVSGKVMEVTPERLHGLFDDGGIDYDESDESEDRNYLKKAFKAVLWVFTQ